MSLDKLIAELHKLNRADKLRAMQILVADLAAEETALLNSNTTYELVTPYGNEKAAKVLYDVLQNSDKDEA